MGDRREGVGQVTKTDRSKALAVVAAGVLALCLLALVAVRPAEAAVPTFAPAVNYPVGDFPRDVTRADFDGDGDDDLAVANSNSNNVSILLNNGVGTFATAVNYAAGDRPISITTADLDGDGNRDLAVTNQIENVVSILPGEGGGTFGTRESFPVGSNPLGVTASDFNGDGDLDLAVANAGSDNVSVLLQNDPPTISDIPDQSTDEDTSTGPISFTVGDDETAAGDLALTGSSSNTTLVPNANIVFGGSGADRTVTVTPTDDRSGTATITVTVRDSQGATATDTFVLTVNAVNDAPDAVNDTATADEGGNPVDIDVLANDTDVGGDALTIESNTQPPSSEGSASCTASSCTFTPNTDFSGTTSFTYTISDGNGGEDTATVSITVNAVNDAPTDPRGCTIKGTNGKDALRGTAGRDVICALGGNDTIAGMGGNDFIYGDAGADTIYGASGRDTITGGPGKDMIGGGGGNDRINSRDGVAREAVSGGAGRDSCIADRTDFVSGCP